MVSLLFTKKELKLSIGLLSFKEKTINSSLKTDAVFVTLSLRFAIRSSFDALIILFNANICCCRRILSFCKPSSFFSSSISFSVERLGSDPTLCKFFISLFSAIRKSLFSFCRETALVKFIRSSSSFNSIVIRSLCSFDSASS